jgi:hypothetical protein
MKAKPGNARRALLKGLLVAPGLLLVRAPGSAQEPLPKLSESDPAAKALAYHQDADSIDPAAIPQRGSDEYCHNCNFLKGQKGQEWRPCEIFPGRRVNADGWCKTWARVIPGG